ncbi:methionyl-tRNA formyltransferase [Candidatus Poribacteria bacterium]|nr:methionyl-tRNA formyltransferase [Candidatus Poribacteria bacterium]
MNILFLGTPEFAVPTLKLLTQTRHRILAALTQPDRPKGRGMKLIPSPVKTIALEYGLLVMQPERASSAFVIEEIRNLNPDAAVVVAYGQILRRDFLDLPVRGCINLHPSLLPRYRGPTPIQSAIMAGDHITGVTTMLLDEGMDTGDILLQREVVIHDDDTLGTMHDTLAGAGADLMVETLGALEMGSATPRKQDDSKATITRKLTREDEIINWNRSPEAIHNLVRALDPWPGCATTYRGETLKVWKVGPWDEQTRGGEPGEIIMSARGLLLVRAAAGAVRLLEVQPQGGRRMSVEEYLRGHALEEGGVLGK